MEMRIAVYGSPGIFDPALGGSARENVEYSLSGEVANRPEQSSIYFRAESESMHFNNRTTLYQVCQNMLGCELKDVIPILENAVYMEHDGFNHLLKNPTLQQRAMIKSVFLFYWKFELAIMERTIVVSNEIYDNFILDITGRAGKQRDIYFIPREFSDPQYSRNVRALIDRNMLYQFTFVRDAMPPLISYFIPLIKPANQLGYFQGKDGDEIYRFWKTLLARRDFKLRTFLNQY